MSHDPTVIVVDDDAAVVAALTALLTSFGLRVITFSSAEELLEKCDLEQGSCLLLDVRLPGMNGLELQEVLQARGNTLPVIFISGHADKAISERALASGAVQFFTKPCNGKELHASIRQALENTKQQNA